MAHKNNTHDGSSFSLDLPYQAENITEEVTHKLLMKRNKIKIRYPKYNEVPWDHQGSTYIKHQKIWVIFHLEALFFFCYSTEYSQFKVWTRSEKGNLPKGQQL